MPEDDGHDPVVGDCPRGFGEGLRNAGVVVRPVPMLAGRVGSPGPYGWHAQNADLVARLKDGQRQTPTVRSKAEAKDLLALTSALVRKSVWILGGDGWAYDIRGTARRAGARVRRLGGAASS